MLHEIVILLQLAKRLIESAAQIIRNNIRSQTDECWSFPSVEKVVSENVSLVQNRFEQ